MYIDMDYILARVKQEDLKAVTREKDGPDEINETKVNAAIVDASAEFDRAAAQAGYVIPIVNPDDFVKRVVFDIALYYLYAGKYDDEEMKDVYVRYNKAFQKLNAIAEGDIKLVNAEAVKLYDLNTVIKTNKTIEDRKFANLGVM